MEWSKGCGQRGGHVMEWWQEMRLQRFHVRKMCYKMLFIHSKLVQCFFSHINQIVPHQKHLNRNQVYQYQSKLRDADKHP